MKYELAIASYQKAADYFTMENSNYKSYEYGCLLKAADLMSTNDDKNYKTPFQEIVKVIFI